MQINPINTTDKRIHMSNFGVMSGSVQMKRQNNGYVQRSSKEKFQNRVLAVGASAFVAMSGFFLLVFSKETPVKQKFFNLLRTN